MNGLNSICDTAKERINKFATLPIVDGVSTEYYHYENIYHTKQRILISNLEKKQCTWSLRNVFKNYNLTCIRQMQIK